MGWQGVEGPRVYQGPEVGVDKNRPRCLKIYLFPSVALHLTCDFSSSKEQGIEFLLLKAKKQTITKKKTLVAAPKLPRTYLHTLPNCPVYPSLYVITILSRLLSLPSNLNEHLGLPLLR